jgi:hypothetical protein
MIRKNLVITFIIIMALAVVLIGIVRYSVRVNVIKEIRAFAVQEQVSGSIDTYDTYKSYGGLYAEISIQEPDEFTDQLCELIERYKENQLRAFPNDNAVHIHLFTENGSHWAFSFANSTDDTPGNGSIAYSNWGLISSHRAVIELSPEGAKAIKKLIDSAASETLEEYIQD